MKKLSPTLVLLVILIAAYTMRVWRLSEPANYYFDEVYHAFTANAYAQNDPRGYEWWNAAPEGVAYEWLHPPISKLFMGLSIYVLGNNSFAWRFPSSIFGVLTIWAVYYLAVQLTNKKWFGVLAAFIASLDGLLLAQSRIAMNDIFVTFFMIMALAFYWRYVQKSRTDQEQRKEILVAGLFTGLAVATKWSGVFILPIIAVWEWQRMLRLKPFSDWVSRLFVTMSMLVVPLFSLWLLVGKQTTWYWVDLKTFAVVLLGFDLVIVAMLMGIRKLLQLLVAFALIPAAIYILSYSQFFLQGHTWKQFRDLHQQIIWYQTNLQATHPYQSRPWEWALDLKPVWFYVNYQDDAHIGNIYALANPLLAWVGLAAVIWMGLVGLIEKKSWQVFTLVSYLLVWSLWTFSPRIMFFYHYTPAIPMLAIGITSLVWWLKSMGKVGLFLGSGIVAAIALVCVWFYPHWTGLVIPKTLNGHYYWFQSWR